jgi:hypothetical protein
MIDVGDYCRRVEDYLTRVNAGHLVRIVGPGFGLVREWAERSVPLSVVFRGIENKAERHRHGKSTRPLRIEFCAEDVRAVFDQWRRAVGLDLTAGDDPDASGATQAASPAAEAPARPPALGRHLDRIIDKLARASGREDLPAGLRDEADRIMQAAAALRESSSRLRGDAKAEAIETLAGLEEALRVSVRAHAPAEWISSLRQDAELDLAPFRSRLEAGAWNRSIDLTVDRLLRDRFSLPHLSL